MVKKSILYFIRKLMIFLLSVLILSIAVFYISRLAPGDPLVAFYGDRTEKMSPEQRVMAEHSLGLDEPVYMQYAKWLRNALNGDFGISYKYKQDVLQVIEKRMGNTLILGGLGLMVIFLGALGLGVLCAWREDRPLDRILCKAGTIISCIPEFFMSLILILIFAIQLRWLPSSGAYSIGGNADLADRAAHLVLPLTVTVLTHLWYYAYLIRNKLLEEVRADYVLLAKSKGLGSSRILWMHCLRNIFPGYLSLMAVSVSHILGGTYIVETVFSYPGLGTLSYESARYQDYNLLMLLCLMSGTLVIFCNILAQIINERIDPRMRDSIRTEETEVDRIG